MSDLRDGTRARVGEDGRFSLSGVSYGIARVVAESGELRSPVVEVEITEDASPEIELRLYPMQRRDVTLRVHDSSGLPVPGAFVFVETVGRPAVILTTDSAGATTFRLAKDDEPRLRVAAIASGQWALGDWLSITERNGDISVRLGQAGTLAIRGSPHGGLLRLVSQTGWDISAMLRAIGVRARGDEPSIVVPGLPAGAYVVAMGAMSRTVQVAANRLTEVDFSR